MFWGITNTKDLSTLSDWARIWQMNFNIDKCILLRFTRSHSPIINGYFLNNQVIQYSDVYKYLGIQLNNTLSWNTHITTIVNKATRMLNFIKRNLSKCIYTIKSTAYTTLVRSILEYATEVWDPHHKFLIRKIEMVQRRAARWVLSDYRLQSSVTAMIDELGWVTLEQRCRRNRLIQLYKIINGYIPGAGLPAIYLPQTIITRHYHPSRFILPAANTILITKLVSFTALHVKDWNDLPLNFYSIPNLSILLMHTHSQWLVIIAIIYS